jgi:hypothetical protein
MKLSPIWFATLALAASCATAAPTPEAHVHAAPGSPGAAEPHACQPPDVAPDAPDALSHTPHTPGRPEIRYYVVSDA